jgi:hypothetical protein
MDLRGKDYLPVAARLQWFRDQYPNGIITTEHIEITDQRAVFRAMITRVGEGGEVLGSSSGYGSETPGDFRDYIEKSETKAIGRALGTLGYGTQFTYEFDEGERIVDTPQRPPAPPPSRNNGQPSGPASPGLAATDRQRGLIQALARDLKIDDEALDGRCIERFGVPLSDISRQDASAIIDSLKEAQTKREAVPA